MAEMLPMPDFRPRTDVDLSPVPSQLKAYEPTIREHIAQALLPDGRPSALQQRMVQGLFGTTGLPSMDSPNYGLADLIPGVSNALTGAEAVETRNPALAALAAVPMSKLGRAALSPIGEFAARKASTNPNMPSYVSALGRHTAEELPIQLASAYEQHF